MTRSEAKSLMIQEMVDAGELIQKGDDYFEDMGGHILHESNLDSYITEFMKNLRPDERRELISRISDESRDFRAEKDAEANEINERNGWSK